MGVTSEQKLLDDEYYLIFSTDAYHAFLGIITASFYNKLSLDDLCLLDDLEFQKLDFPYYFREGRELVRELLEERKD